MLCVFSECAEEQMDEGILCKIMYGLATCDLANILSVIIHLLGKSILFWYNLIIQYYSIVLLTS